MTLKWALFALLQYEVLVITSPSIVGVTYRDDFDFEQRYQDVNECNPFHWHPLHLPEMCADMFEKLIRSKLGSKGPVRVVVDGEQNTVAPSEEYIPDSPEYDNSDEEHYTPHQVPSTHHIEPPSFSPEIPVYEMDSPEEYTSVYEPRPVPDYEVMLQQLMQDIAKDPSHPKIEMVPNVGPAAVYRQEISKKSEDMIKYVAKTYAEYIQQTYDAYANFQADPQIYVWDSRKNKTEELKMLHDKNKKKHNKKNHGKKNNINKKNSRMSRKKSEKDGLVTIIETLRPEKRRRRRRSALYLLSL